MMFVEPAQPRRRRKRPSKLAAPDEGDKIQWLCSAIKNALAELTLTSFWSGTRANLEKWLEAHPEKTVRCYCFGLGSFENSAAARHQFAFVIAILEALPLTDNHNVLIRDPIMTEIDLAAASRCLPPGQQAEVSTAPMPKSTLVGDSELTLCIMPHCTRAMYSDLLEAHWEAEKLRKLAILGNSFSLYETRFCNESDWSFLEKSIVFSQEIPCPDAKLSPLHSAYNDQSFHSFPERRVPDSDDEAWVWSMSDSAREKMKDHS